MKTRVPIGRCAKKIMPVLLASTLPAAVQAQFDYTTNNGTITITAYTGRGGDVEIPSTTNGLPVTRIGDLAFLDCRRLGSVTIPDSVTSIGYGAFNGCDLDRITLPNSVTHIGEGAFYACARLEDITIPHSVTSIGHQAFGYCPSLTRVYFQGNAPDVGGEVFIESPGVTVYYLPCTAGWGATYSDRPTVPLWGPCSVPTGIQSYAGLTITGYVGTVYAIEYVPDLDQALIPNAWRCLEFLQLPASPYLWTDKSAPATGQRFYRAVVFEAPTNMVFIPPGTFRMGSPSNEVDRQDDEGPQTDVIISRGFWLGKYEVTQGEYLAVIGSNPSHFTGDTNRPVELVNWFEATNYCATLTQRERAAGRIATNSVYRLPTEAEWEYACRGWTSTRFSYGDDPGYTNLTDYAWYDANSAGTTHPVGQKLPNPWGLYDIHGNVYEWCQDWYGTYLGGIAFDPQGPASGADRVFHGGSWGGNAGDCRSASRSNSDPDDRDHNFGFRVLLAPVQP